MKKTWMLSKTVVAIYGICAFVPVAHSQQTNIDYTHKQQNDIQQLFNQAHIQGVLVIDNKNVIQTFGNALQRAQTYYVPASTFKMVNALIGLENNIATPNEIFKWDGKKHMLSSWEKDMTLGEATRLSAVPVYQALARRTGLSLMQKEIKRIHYGNETIGNQVDKFWLVGPLKITPVQEAQFAYQFAYQQLPFKKQVQNDVQQMLFITQKNGNKIYAKSGLGVNKNPRIGWLTGWVEKPNGDKIAFSLNLEMKPNLSLSLRNDLTYKSLKILNIL
ncbi:Beta-lactamase class D (YbxI) (PDB:5CTN) [Commensalibacter communis]|uniref:Beta-lactamase class D (YbxI) n=1 Tax=Commensalibacter communis TaxID=2972786 RepID=A0A9W4TNU8_9PROT|nr:class D beta-lactamase [Commensalibacter communis]CAI3924304.1 Beta-lactamase class D (YbxI) (PDB:5CTN) [Commensalibacter communis]CAI3924822.1 Beta-lactamase class D (YbxI) (PDB:5CTN) [Commensalibacter communis]CAI3936957.1 Beta-lactamase class D (YbxI) (PDB:5CTN) [Commensalibacter communis]CAI3945826.1 Beta-lactamase class D (YbxI) (PDB:5CTN) [Commensalibacter communis]CAI3946543.1 Beta-lactamase class D (YbxI) (PDB:5CTN) [Commensalibacter communis]